MVQVRRGATLRQRECRPSVMARLLAYALCAALAAEFNCAWARRGITLGLGIGVAKVYATIGAIGFESRIDDGAIGTVTNLAARLCARAAPGEILVDRKTVGAVEGLVATEDIGERELRGFSRPVLAAKILGLKPAG
jgi:class 3 adenylate cyclase